MRSKKLEEQRKQKVYELSRELLLQKCDEINEEIVDICVDMAKHLVDKVEKI